jgi:zinc/manganese transport system substrate-binding protein
MQIGAVVVVVIIVAIGGYILYSGGQGSGATTTNTSPTSATPTTLSYAPSTTQSSVSMNCSGAPLQIVAAENFWGSLVTQLAGNCANVTSIVTDPNADPHEYEASPADAQAIANANYVIVNDVGYDDWATKLLAASNNPNTTVFNVGDYLGVADGSNPHLWYNPYYVNATVAHMYNDLVTIDPADKAYYLQQYATLNASLASLNSREMEIKQQFGGTQVASTESIFVYLANYTGLDLVSPPEFMEAVAEGNDPSVQSIAEFQNQLESGNVSVLVYNEQTVTPLTTQMKQIAVDNNVTIVGVTETIQPPDTSFQVWMNGQLLALQNALNANALGN